MWNRKKDESFAPCEHEDVTVSSTAGLSRTVCGDCGHVSVGYLYDVFEEKKRQLIEMSEPASE